MVRQCKCRLDASFCNNKQRWNEDICRCEFKQLIDKRTCNKGFNWNTGRCKCECDKSCDVGEHLDYKNCNVRKGQLINQLKNIVKILMRRNCIQIKQLMQL